MHDEPKICHYIDIPVQSGADTILKRMGRKTDTAEIEDIVNRLRKSMPDICIRTTLITGFPGETADDHRKTMEFVRTKIMKLQQQIAFEAAGAMIGRKVCAVIEGRITNTDTDSLTYVGRTYKDAPDIDGYLFINGVNRELMTGDFVTVKITGSHEYDLIGEIYDESAE